MPDNHHQPGEDPHRIRDLATLRAVYKPPMDAAVRKVLHALDQHCRAYLAQSPFCVLATSNKAGILDASPKGGPAGFVLVQDDATILIPDWPGNNRLDSLENIIDNPRIGILSFLPGMNEMLRINGRAEISTDPVLRAKMETEGKLPISVIVVRIDEVYLHCARALQRSALWDAGRQIARASFPTLGRMIADQIAGYDADASDRFIEANKNNLYGGAPVVPPKP